MTSLLSLDALQKLTVTASLGRTLPTQILLVDSDLRWVIGDESVLGQRSLPDGFKGKPGERLDLLDSESRTLVIGCGKRAPDGGDRLFWESAGGTIAQALQATGVDEAELAGPAANEQQAQNLVVGLLLAGYDNGIYRSIAAKTALAAKRVRIPGLPRKTLEAAQQIAGAVNWTRALVDAPANHLTPAAFADEGRTLTSLGVKLEVLDEPALRKLGAHGLLEVGRASRHAPCMVVARWMGRAGKDTDLAIVGKGLTFDGGGLNLKMMLIEKMKFDMGGAAAALGTLRLLAQRKARVNVVAVLPLCENVISGDAYRPGDVIQTLAGLTVEVANTDAEGRIVLADGLTYARRFAPKFLVDIATLTGSISMTLHQEFAGLFSADDELATMISDAATASGDLVWRMPLSPLQDYLVDSDIADVRNIGPASGLGLPAYGSAVAGAKFLERFAPDMRWAHLDMASVVLSTRQRGAVRAGPTGWGVRLLDELAERTVQYAGPADARSDKKSATGAMKKNPRR